MASKLSCIVFIAIISFFVSVIAARPAKQFRVGSSAGWVVPPATNASFYNLWAASNRFRVGDSLLFQYSEDSVLMVEKWGYHHCEVLSPILAFNDGNTTVEIDRPGLFYFISGISDHCRHGQRMIVDVMSPRPLPPDGAPLPAPTSGSALLSGATWLVTALAASVAMSS